MSVVIRRSPISGTFDNEQTVITGSLSGGAARTADAIVAHPDPAGADAEILAEINSVNTGTHTVSVQLGNSRRSAAHGPVTMT